MESLRPRSAVMKGEIPKIFLRIIKKYPPLKREDQIALCYKARAGDKQARDILVYSNLGFVIRVARSYSLPPSLEFDDVIQAGTNGVVEAIDRFDPSRKYSFTTYAYAWVRKKIVEAITSNISIIKVPNPSIYALQGLAKRADRKSHQEGRDVQDTIACAMDEGMDYKALQATRNAIENVMPTDHQHIIHEAEYERAERSRHQLDMAQKIEEAMKALNPLEQDIIKRLFGIGCTPQTMKEIAEHHIVHRERVRQLKKIAIQKMRRALGVDIPEPGLFDENSREETN